MHKILFSFNVFALVVSKEDQQKLDEVMSQIEFIAKSEILVDQVRQRNRQLPSEYLGLTNEKWKTLSVVNDLVKKLQVGVIRVMISTKFQCLAKIGKVLLLMMNRRG